MTFDYGLPAELFMAKRKGGARSRLLVVVLPPPLRQSGSLLRSFRQFEPSALGCRSETSASTGKTSIAVTKATSFLYDAEWTECSSCGYGSRRSRGPISPHSGS
jgi:hypothetical protein